MLRINEIILPLDHSDDDLKGSVLRKLGVPAESLQSVEVFKRSYDARNKRSIKLIYQLDVALSATFETSILQRQQRGEIKAGSVRTSPNTDYQFVGQASPDFPSEGQQRPVIIGFGPCGILAALVLAQMGFKPIVLERGKDVRRRTKDTWNFWRNGILNPESNVQYGEGGAGTFSDGKLYSQIKDKRFLSRKVLAEFVKAGAPAEILSVSKPHIGTFKLVKMVENIRAEIIRLGGEIRFDQKVESVQRENGKIVGLTVSCSKESGKEGEEFERHIKCQHVILAIGHSARDTFYMLRDQGVYMEAKPFSIGFRIEHPQLVIDKARFGDNAGHPILGAADYKLVHHCKNQRSVYSFCMCPGGTVVAAASEEGRVVINGMSQYSRNERNANSAIVVGIEPEQDYPGDVLAGVELQRELEEKAFALGGGDYSAPAQLLGDFLENKPTGAAGGVKPSYTPGVKWGSLNEALPSFAIDALREAIPVFEKKIKGFAAADTVLTGVETRTSSPVCIRRGKDLMSINTEGLYPAGEGAGYAGGILSAAIDGVKVAEKLAEALLKL